MADVSKVKINNNEYNLKDATARENKVSKSGDTMTGTLNIKSTSIDSSVTPSTTQFLTMVRGLDKNNVENSIIRTSFNTNGNETLQFVTHRVVNGVDKYNNFSIGFDASGNPIFYTDNQSEFRNALGASSGIWPTSVGGTGGTDSQWQSYTDSNVFTGTIYYRKIGTFFMIQATQINVKNTVSAGSYVQLMIVPSTYRPSREIFPTCFTNNSAINVKMVGMRLADDGRLFLYANKTEAITTSYNLFFSGFGFM